LRERAERVIRETADKPLEVAVDATRSPEQIVHELEIHQVELKLQNEELRRAQDQLAQTRDEFMEFFQLAPVGYLVLSETGLIYRHNLTICTMLRLAPTALRGSVFGQFIARDWLSVYYSNLALLRSRRQRAVLELRLSLPGGETLPVHCEMVWQQRGQGCLPQILCTLTDISRSVDAEQALWESERRFRLIANYSNDWETWFALDGTPRWVNPAVKQFTGFSSELCLTMQDFPLPVVHPDDTDRMLGVLERAKRGESGGDVAIRFQHREGPLIWGMVSWQPMYDDNEIPLGFRTSIGDITARKQAEAALIEAREKADQANLAKTRFLAAASHDLRQPVQALTAYVDILSSITLPPQAARFVPKMKQPLGRVNHILGALLDVSCLDAGIVEVNRGVFPAGRLLEELVSEYETQAETLEISLRCVRSTARIESDASQLARLLGNLFSNALKFSQRGKVLVGCRRRRDGLEIQIIDTGPGIPPVEEAAIFEEFYQLGGRPGLDRGTGLGLGLAIVKRLAGILRVPVWLRSIEGRGTVFSVLVPYADAASDADAVLRRGPSSLPTPERVSGGNIVLVLEDNPDVRLALGDVLQLCGFISIMMANLEDFKARLAPMSDNLAVIVADYRLTADLTGLQAVRVIRDWIKRPVPAVILTGDTSSETLAGLAESGLPFLHKPVSVEALRAKLHQAMAEAA